MRRIALWMLLCGLASGCNLGFDAASESPIDVSVNPTRTAVTGVNQSPTSTTNAPVSSSPSAATIAPTTTNGCTIRTEWPLYTVARGDTLSDIANRSGSSVSELTTANCLDNPDALRVGQQLHVPRALTSNLPPTLTPHPGGCEMDYRWPMYTLSESLTLQAIANRTQSTVDELVRSNCLVNPALVQPDSIWPAGSQIRVPFLPGTSNGNTTYTSPYGFAMDYPQTWYFINNTGGYPGAVIYSVPPQDIPPFAGGSWEGIFVLAYIALPDSAVPNSLEQWVEEARQGYEDAEHYRVVVNPRPFTLSSGIRGIRMDTGGGGPTTWNFYFVRNGTYINLSIQGEDEAVMQAIINSIRPA